MGVEHPENFFFYMKQQICIHISKRKTSWGQGVGEEPLPKQKNYHKVNLPISNKQGQAISTPSFTIGALTGE